MGKSEKPKIRKVFKAVFLKLKKSLKKNTKIEQAAQTKALSINGITRNVSEISTTILTTMVGTCHTRKIPCQVLNDYYSSLMSKRAISQGQWILEVTPLVK